MKVSWIITLTAFLSFSPIVSNCQNFDLETLRRLENTRSPFMNKTMESVSNSVYIVSPAIPIGLISAGIASANKNITMAGIQIGSGLLISMVSNYGTKNIFKRPRPYDTYPDILTPLAHETSFSFPSGHTSSAFNLATSLSLQFPKWHIAVPAFIWASTVAFSRMYLGVHYPSDVFIGIIMGVATAYLSYKVKQWIYPVIQNHATIKL
jgi:membrane-associated phospholipid phosphatase